MQQGIITINLQFAPGVRRIVVVSGDLLREREEMES